MSARAALLVMLAALVLSLLLNLGGSDSEAPDVDGPPPPTRVGSAAGPAKHRGGIAWASWREPRGAVEEPMETPAPREDAPGGLPEDVRRRLAESHVGMDVAFPKVRRTGRSPGAK